MPSRSLALFLSALVLLLLAPGPTNLLLALAGAGRGLRGSAPLVAAALGGYLTTILPLAAFAGPLLSGAPLAANIVKLCAAAWVMALAVRLWTAPASESGEVGVPFRAAYFTTVFNPKGLVIGLALIPAGPLVSVFPYLLAVAAVIVVVALLWITLGAAVLGTVHRRNPVLVSRFAACLLLFFAAGLAGKVVGLV